MAVADRGRLALRAPKRKRGVRQSLLLVDDHRMFVEMLCQWLGQTYDIVGVAYRADELITLLGTTEADALVLDLQLPDRSDVGVITDVRRVRPALRVLVLTMFRDRAVAEAAFAAGADGFIPKDAEASELARALAEVLAGRRYLSPLVPKSSHRTGLESVHPALRRLTSRQQDVLCMLGGGLREGEIAERLGIASSTVTFHKHNIQRILGVETDRALLGYAVLVHGCLAERAPGAVVACGGAAAGEGPSPSQSEPGRPRG